MSLVRSYTCGLCGWSFQNPLQLGPHVRFCKNANTVIRFTEVDNMEFCNVEFGKTPHARQTPLPTQVPTQNQLVIQTPQLPSQTPQVPTQTPQVPIPQVPTQTQLPTQTPLTMSCARVGGGPRVVVEDVPLSSVTNIVSPNPF